MWGGSYVGATQWQAATEKPPGLVTIVPTATWSSFYRNLYLGGALRISLITGWAAGQSPRPDGVEVTADWRRTLLHLPLSEVDEQVGWSIPWLEGMLTHPRPDGYWKRVELTEEIIELDLPMQHIVSRLDWSLIDRRPGSRHQRSQFCDGTCGCRIVRIRLKAVCSFCGLWWSSIKRAIAVRSICLALRVKIKRRGVEPVGRPSATVVPDIIAHREVLDRYINVLCVVLALLQITTKPLEILTCRIDHRIRAEIHFADFRSPDRTMVPGAEDELLTTTSTPVAGVLLHSLEVPDGFA